MLTNDIKKVFERYLFFAVVRLVIVGTGAID